MDDTMTPTTGPARPGHQSGLLPAPLDIADTGVLARVGALWSSTSFGAPDLADYAIGHIERETRRGLGLLALAALLFLAQTAGFASWFGLGPDYSHTYVLLAALALHIFLSARQVRDVRALNLLAMLLLVVCASALVLLALRSGTLHVVVMLSVATLLMLVPLMPWGLREASLTCAAIYAMFTSLTFFSRMEFGHIAPWALQLGMFTTTLLSLALVGRALGVRKNDLAMRFGLERAGAAMAVLAERDHLTGAWNRRFLERSFEALLARHAQRGAPACFGLLDIDQFKPLNDTWGHRHGDSVLQAVAAAFDGLDGELECLVRLGGDEFAFILAGSGVPHARLAAILAGAARLAARSGERAIAAPTFSAGLVLLDRPCTLDAAYAQADALLYQVKRAGGAGIGCGSLSGGAA